MPQRYGKIRNKESVMRNYLSSKTFFMANSNNSLNSMC